MNADPKPMRTFRIPRFTFAILFLFAASVSADPQPGTPGNSGNNNPHGSPPGQGGPVPGNSGGNNPHGTPPGQRITAPGGPEQGAASGAGGGASTGSGIDIGNRHFFAGTQPSYPGLKRTQKYAEFLNQVKGWEPAWEYIADAFYEVAVDVRVVRTWKDRASVQEVLFEKKGEDSGGVEVADETRREWRLLPPVRWSRLNGGAWEQYALGEQGRLADERALVSDRIRHAWNSEIVDVVPGAGGTYTVRFMRRVGGTMAWEVDSWKRVVRLQAWSPLGHTEWEETRAFEVFNGREVLRERRRQWRGGQVDVETCIWHGRSAAQTMLKAPLP